MITIYDIAEKCKVSPSTVSKALNGKNDVSENTKEEIVRIAHEMGYVSNQIAKNLITKRTYNIGVLLKDEMFEGYKLGFTHVFFAEILNGFKWNLENRGYDISFISNKNAVYGYNYLQNCRAKRFDGIFILCADFCEAEVQELMDYSNPVVAFDHFDARVSTITSDNEEIYYQMAKHVVSAGYKTLVFCNGGDTDCSVLRRKGVERAAAECGIKDLFFRDVQYYSDEEGYAFTKSFLKEKFERPCIFYPDDYSALGGIKAAQESGVRFPDECGLVGCDGTRILQKFSPRLTTVRQNSYEIGREAALTLIDRVNGAEKGDSPIVIPAELVFGDTCL